MCYFADVSSLIYVYHFDFPIHFYQHIYDKDVKTTYTCLTWIFIIAGFGQS